MLLQKLREHQRVTRRELAEALGVAQSNISRIEHEDDPHVSTIRKFVEALGGELVLQAKIGDRDDRPSGPRNDIARRREHFSSSSSVCPTFQSALYCGTISDETVSPTSIAVGPTGRRLRILAIEPTYGGSRRAFVENLVNYSRHEIVPLTLPARFWKWRMRGAHYEMARLLTKCPVHSISCWRGRCSICPPFSA